MRLDKIDNVCPMYSLLNVMHLYIIILVHIFRVYRSLNVTSFRNANNFKKKLLLRAWNCISWVHGHDVV